MGKYRELLLKEDDVKIVPLKAFHSFDDTESWNTDLNNFIDAIEAKQQRTFVRITRAKKKGFEIGQIIRDVVLSNPEKSREIGKAIGAAIRSPLGD